MNLRLVAGAATGLVILLQTTEGRAGDCDNVPLTTNVTKERVGDSLCNATCGALQTFKLSGPTASGTGIGPAGRLEFIDQWHGQCRVKGGPLEGQCSADTTCLPGQTKFADGGVWKCKSTLTVTVPNPDRSVCIARSSTPLPAPPNGPAAREVAALLAREGQWTPAADTKWREIVTASPNADLVTVAAYVHREAMALAEAEKAALVAKQQESSRKIADLKQRIQELEKQRKGASTKTVERLRSELDNEQDASTQRQLQLQMAAQRLSQLFQTLSNLMKKMHDTAMAAITNLKG